MGKNSLRNKKFLLLIFVIKLSDIVSIEYVILALSSTLTDCLSACFSMLKMEMIYICSTSYSQYCLHTAVKPGKGYRLRSVLGHYLGMFILLCHVTF